MRIWDLEFGFQDSGLRVKGLRFRVEGLGHRLNVLALDFRVNRI